MYLPTAVLAAEARWWLSGKDENMRRLSCCSGLFKPQFGFFRPGGSSVHLWPGGGNDACDCGAFTCELVRLVGAVAQSVGGGNADVSDVPTLNDVPMRFSFSAHRHQLRLADVAEGYGPFFANLRLVDPW
jgi:hypothetical protein